MFTDPNGKWTGQGAEGSGLDILIAGGEHIHIPIKENSLTCQSYGKIFDYTTHPVVIKYYYTLLQLCSQLCMACQTVFFNRNMYIYMCSRSFLTLIDLFLIHITIAGLGLPLQTESLSRCLFVLAT